MIYQEAHDHLGWGSGVSGVYYASYGWPDPDPPPTSPLAAGGSASVGGGGDGSVEAGSKRRSKLANRQRKPARDRDGGFVTPKGLPGSGTNSTLFNLVKPFEFAGAADAGPFSFLSIDPTPGTFVIFPSWLRHSADVHIGPSRRISVPFNIQITVEQGEVQMSGGIDPAMFGIDMSGPSELDVRIPDDHCGGHPFCKS
jgi:hypothetical protein